MRTQLIEIPDGEYGNLGCGKCFSVLMGYDEEICPVCGAFVDMDNPITMTDKEFEAKALEKGESVFFVPFMEGEKK